MKKSKKEKYRHAFDVAMKIKEIVSNILWILLGGIWLASLWVIIGILLCITLVGIPFGLECFKAAKLSIMPYGKKVVWDIKSHPFANGIWLLLIGWEMAIVYFMACVANCITIIGISKGLQCFKIMKLAIFPFGAKIEK